MVKAIAKLVLVAVSTVLVAGPAAAIVQSEPAVETPKSFNYELRDGKRVPRANRVTAADGSWREEVRQGQCTTVKQKTANGDYSETRKCD